MAPPGTTSTAMRRVTRARASGRKPMLASAQMAKPAPEKSRRFVLGLIPFITLPAGKALAGQFKGKNTWNGEKGRGMCDLGEEGDECRFGQLAQDQQALKDRVLSKTSNAPITRDGKAQTGQAASVINDEYFKLSESLIGEIDAYLELDVFDKQRKAATSSIQLNGKTWTSKYAPGGSARLESAQKIYVVVDSLLGHFASNGYAPLPAGIVSNIRSRNGEATILLAKGK